MKNKFLNLILVAGMVASSLMANAIAEVRAARAPRTQANVSRSTEAGDCAPSASQFNMDINNVRAMLLGGGDAWWNFATPQYNVPKTNGTTPAVDALFAGAIWITGLDAGGNLKCAAVRYRQNGNDYWPGPLTNGAVSATTCSQYDVHFNVLGTDIAAAQTAFLQNGSNTTEGMIPKDVLSWPGVGNPYISTDPTLLGQTYDITDVLAPFKDVGGTGIYDPVLGDYPVIPYGASNAAAHAYADQMVFWVFNDQGNIHTESGGQAIGVQVNTLGFAFQSTDNINNMTFYKYQIINKSSNKLFQTYMSQWVDPDLGCYENDRVGCDTTRALGICYNGTIPDPDCGIENGYGYDLPIIGVDFFEGPLSDSGTQIGLSSFVYFTNGAVFGQTDPETAAQYRNYQTGLWNDGTPFTAGGTGYNSGGPKTKFIFPGNPAIANQWSECEVANLLPPGDRRFVQSSGPFTLNPGIQQYITVGVVFVQPNTTDGVGLCPDFTQNIDPADDEAQNLFNTGFQLLNGPDAPTLQIRELSNEVVINLVNLPGSNNAGENYVQVDGATEQAVKLLLGGHGDSTYRFQGYQLFQVTGPEVTASNLTDPTKAQLIADVDIKDGVAQIINFIKDANLGLYVPTDETPSATDNGVLNSFLITQDLFATGNNKNLINHTTYYFTAVAYAYNDYLPFNQNDPQAGGQLTPYLQGRNNFNVYAAIPHIPDPRNDGTVLNSQWGQGVNVERIEGAGNGGSPLELNPQSVSAILASGNYAFLDTLTYNPGSDPIGFKITDPVSLVEGDFELKFYDTTGNNKPIGNTTSWFLHDVTNGDTIYSDRTLDRPYEQQIMLTRNSQTTDYGFSITLGTPPPVYTIPNNYLNPTGVYNRNTYYPLLNNDSILFQNPSQQWLSFLVNTGTTSPTHWIRSGTNALNPTSSAGGQSEGNPLAGVYDDNWYYTQGYGSGTPPAYVAPNSGFLFDDSNNVYNTILNGEWAPYCLTANYNLPSSVAASAPPYVYGPGFRWRNYPSSASEIAPPQNTLDRLQSVDIVITPDKTKWTRCVVFETGENESINQGNSLWPRSYNKTLAGDGAFKGQIRMAYSKDMDKNGNLVTADGVNDPSLNYEIDTGRSWFPGYAINVENGQRLNIAFGEASDEADQNGADMLWNPTQNLYSPLGATYFAGEHFIYVMDTKYDQGQAAHDTLLRSYDSIPITMNLPKYVYPVYQHLMWTCIPFLSQGFDFNVDANGLKCLPPSEVTIKLRVQTPYNRFATVATDYSDSSATMPRYRFSTFGLGAKQEVQSVGQSALDLIKIVPNPYLSYSVYETDQNSSVVMITNLPNVCNVTIYSLDGTIIRKLSRSIGIDPATHQQVDVSEGQPVSTTITESSLTWDMKNSAEIPISSGVYLFHIEAPGLGEKTLKWFCTIRPADTSDY